MTPKETYFLLESNRPRHKTFANFASRIAHLLESGKVKSVPDLQDTLDLLLGAVYALIFADREGFVDRTCHKTDPKAYLKRAKQITEDRKVRTNGKWIAGFHFNSALFRLAASYDRSLQIIVPKAPPLPGKTEVTVSARKAEATKQYSKWRWTNIHNVYWEANTLKHDPDGTRVRRYVKYEQAMLGAEELLDLIKAWVDAS